MNSQIKIVITSAIVVIVLMLVGFFFVFPLLNKISDSSEDFLRTKNELVRVEQASEDLSRLTRELENYKDLEGNIQKSLISQERLVSFFTLLEGMARQLTLNYNLQLITSNDSSQMSFQINLSGSFNEVAAFISGLENLSFLNQVNRWQIVRIDPISDPPENWLTSTNVNATLNMGVFSQQ